VAYFKKELYAYDYGYRHPSQVRSNRISTLFPAESNVFNLGGKVVKDDESRIPEIGKNMNRTNEEANPEESIDWSSSSEDIKQITQSLILPQPPQRKFTSAS